MAETTINGFIGLDSDSVPDSMDDNALRTADNIILGNKGLQSRGGSSKVTIASVSANYTQMIEWNTPTGKLKYLAIKNKQLCVLEAGVPVSKLTVNSDRIGYAIFMNSLLYFVDGVNYKVWGEFDFFSNSGTKDLTTTNIIKNTPVSTHTTLPGTVDHFYMPKANMLGVNLATADYGDTTKWADVTDSTGSIPDVIRDVAPYIETVTATGTITAYTTTTDLTAIKKCTVIAFHPTSNRMFFAGDGSSAIYFSEIGNPTRIKPANILYPATGLGKAIALAVVTQSLAVGYVNGWMAWNGITPGTDVTWKRLPVPNGCLNPEAWALGKNTLIYFAYDGINLMSASLLQSDTSETVIATDMLQNLTKIKNVTKVCTKGLLCPDRTRVAYHSGHIMASYMHVDNTTLDGAAKINKGDIVLNVPVSTHATLPGTVGKYYQAKSDLGEISLRTADFGSTGKWAEGDSTLSNFDNNRVLFYDEERGGFSRFTGWVVNDFCPRYDNILWFASRNYVLQGFDRLDDINIDTGADQAIHWEIKTKALSLGGASYGHRRKLLNRVFVEVEQSRVSSENIVEMALYSDYEVSEFEGDFAESLIWGRKWGKVWGWCDFISQYFMPRIVGMRHQLAIYSDTLNNPVSLDAICFEYTINSARGNQISSK